jgi:hypothetical protein
MDFPGYGFPWLTNGKKIIRRQPMKCGVFPYQNRVRTTPFDPIMQVDDLAHFASLDLGDAWIGRLGACFRRDEYPPKTQEDRHDRVPPASNLSS